MNKELMMMPRIMVVIKQPEDKKRFAEILDHFGVRLWHECRGKGTAPSEMLDLFGLSGTTRLIAISYLPKYKVSLVFKEMRETLSKKGRGIAFSMPLVGIQGGILEAISKETEAFIKERIDTDMTETREKAQYVAIWASVNSGYSNDVVEAARAKGAKGGTIIKGLRHDAMSNTEHLGIKLKDEQEIVMIIAKREQKKDLMQAICDACGLKTPAHGLVIAIPVDDVLGLEV